MLSNMNKQIIPPHFVRETFSYSDFEFELEIVEKID